MRTFLFGTITIKNIYNLPNNLCKKIIWQTNPIPSNSAPWWREKWKTLNRSPSLFIGELLGFWEGYYWGCESFTYLKYDREAANHHCFFLKPKHSKRFTIFLISTSRWHWRGKNKRQFGQIIFWWSYLNKVLIWHIAYILLWYMLALTSCSVLQREQITWDI